MQNVKINMQKYNSKIKSFSFLLVLLTFHFCLFAFQLPQASAASPAVQSQVIRVSPVIVHVNLTPNQETVYEITVENLLPTPLPVKAMFSDFDTASEDGGYIVTDQTTSPLLSWISLDTKEWIIPAKTKQKVSLTIKTPQRISIGGYYGILFFQPVIPQLQSQTLVSARVGVLLLGDVGVGQENTSPGEILDFHLPIITQDTTLPLLLRVKNTSLNFFTAKPLLHVKPVFGEKTTQFLEEKIIFPGKVRRWEMPVRLKDAGIGIYTVTMDISTGNGNRIQTERLLIIFPWTPVVITISGALFLFWIMRKRRNLKHALKAFFSKEAQE